MNWFKSEIGLLGSVFEPSLNSSFTLTILHASGNTDSFTNRFML